MAEFERLSETPNAIQRLRTMIWSLAMTGALTGGGRSGWRHATLGRIGTWGSGGTPPKSNPDYYNGDIPWIVIGDLNDGVVTSTASSITRLGLSSSSAKLIEPGTVLIAMYGASIGKLGMAGIQCATNQAIAHCVPAPDVDADFLMLGLRSMRSALMARGRGGTQPNISQTILKAWPFPLPSLAEQRRIVSKVDEVMALCDELEATHTKRETRRDRLRTISLRNLVAPDESKDGARFFVQHSPRMITKPEHVAGVRQAILDLAVRGMLVPQDSEDEPFTDFLGKGATEPAGATAGPHDLPQPGGWSRVAIKRLAVMVTSGSRDWARYYSSTGAKFIRAQNIRFGHLLLKDLAHVAIPQKSEGVRTRVQVGDILIVITGAGVTNPGMLESDLGDAYVSQHVGLVRLSNRALAPWILLCLMAPAGARDELVARAYGSGKPNLG